MVKELFILDTYAWVEYLIGSEKGKKVKKIIDREQCLTVECSIAELQSWALKKEVDFEKLYETVRKNSRIIPIFTEDWIGCAKIRHEIRKKIPDFGLVDSLIRFKQLKLKAKIVTGDKHFKELSNALII